MNNFKHGDWVICKWKIENGGHVDICQFDFHIDDKDSMSYEQFMDSKFYRINSQSGNVHHLTTSYSSGVRYADHRYEYNWRKMTDKELKFYKDIIDGHFDDSPHQISTYRSSAPANNNLLMLFIIIGCTSLFWWLIYLLVEFIIK